MYEKWARELESCGCITHRGFLDWETDERYATWIVNAQCRGEYLSAAKNIVSRIIYPIRFYLFMRRQRRRYAEGIIGRNTNQ